MVKDDDELLPAEPVGDERPSDDVTPDDSAPEQPRGDLEHPR